MKKSIIALAAVMVFFVLDFHGQPNANQPQPDLPIDAATKAQIINDLTKELNESYVFADVAKKMETDVRQRLQNKEYDKITSSREFADKLTGDLQSVSKDKHLRVRFSYEKIPVRQNNREPSKEEMENSRRYVRQINFGFEKVERMQGNIGYVDLRGFSDAEQGVETVAAAMSFLTNTDALIFDLRQNGGGSPEMVALISSYLFGEKPVHLNSLYWRKGDKTEEFWTKATVAGKRYGETKDVYVLTSSRTFSAGEEFTYNLKNLKRATIIGEMTGGGAHPGGVFRINDHFGVFVPSGRAINPISKANWEGTGVEPDVKVSKELALKTAYALALNKVAEKTADEQRKKGLKELADKTLKEIEEMKKV
ncbi:MAG TPA: S41 family peptidase, partial [Pyrinomonadaceae bacterium]|nr:S41 family peptidase [Pyrinomonadaceae bacterium]